MTAADARFAAPSVHASAVLVGATALLIRGPSRSGKSRLVLDILDAAYRGALPPARLVADDRCLLAACEGGLLVRPPPILAGLIEWRGLGLLRMEHEPLAQVGAVIDLETGTDRLPDAAPREVSIEGVRLPRYATAPGQAALALVKSICGGHPDFVGRDSHGRDQPRSAKTRGASNLPERPQTADAKTYSLSGAVTSQD